jgi:hypothetical protein
MEVGIVRVNVDAVWGPWAGDFSEAKTPIEAIKIILPPAAPSPSHLLQQVHIAIGHPSSIRLFPPPLMMTGKDQPSTFLVYRWRARKSSKGGTTKKQGDRGADWGNRQKAERRGAGVRGRKGAEDLKAVGRRQWAVNENTNCLLLSAYCFLPFELLGLCHHPAKHPAYFFITNYEFIMPFLRHIPAVEGKVEPDLRLGGLGVSVSQLADKHIWILSLPKSFRYVGSNTP